MTAIRTYSKSADEALLDALTSLMQVTNLIGTEADSENTGVTRAVWMPEKWGTAPLRVQPVDGHGIAEHDRRYTVALHAGTYGGLIELYHALVRALDTKLTREAYELADTDKPVGGTSGWAVLVPVTLKGPIYAEVYGAVTVATTTRSVAVDGESDAAAAQVLS